jgi:hypothetical protein
MKNCAAHKMVELVLPTWNGSLPSTSEMQNLPGVPHSGASLDYRSVIDYDLL